MKTALDKYKGIHPGLILEHELKKRKIPKIQFAVAVNQQRQALNAFTKGKRKLPVELTFKVDKELGYAEGTMLMMQTYYEIEKHRIFTHKSDDNMFLKHIRKGLFWDTDVSKIDWNNNATAIIKRIFERGNKQEKEYIINQYGINHVKQVLGVNPLTLLDETNENNHLI